MDCFKRELTVKELIEQSNIEKKDVILSRLKESDYKMSQRLERCEDVIKDQGKLIESYRTVLKDMIYSNWLDGHG